MSTTLGLFGQCGQKIFAPGSQMIWLKTKKVNYASSVLGFVSWQTWPVTHLVAVACNWKSGTTKYMWLIHWSIEFHRFQLGQYERTKHDSTSIAWGLVNKLGINCRGRGEQGSKGGGLGLGLLEITNFTKLSGKFQPKTRKCFSFTTILHCSQIADASNINWRFLCMTAFLKNWLWEGGSSG